MAEEDDISTFFLPEGLADDLISPQPKQRTQRAPGTSGGFESSLFSIPLSHHGDGSGTQPSLSWTSSPAPAATQGSDFVPPGQAESGARSAEAGRNHDAHVTAALGSLSFPQSSTAPASVGHRNGSGHVGTQASPFGVAGPTPGLSPLSELSATAPAFDPSRRAGPVMARPAHPPYSTPHATTVVAREKPLPAQQRQDQQHQSFLGSMSAHLGIGSSISWPEPSGSMPPQSAGGFVLPTAFGGGHLPASAPISQFSSGALPAGRHRPLSEFVMSNVQPSGDAVATSTAPAPGSAPYSSHLPTSRPQPSEVASYDVDATLEAPQPDARQDHGVISGRGDQGAVDHEAEVEVEGGEGDETEESVQAGTGSEEVPSVSARWSATEQGSGAASHPGSPHQGNGSPAPPQRHSPQASPFTAPGTDPEVDGSPHGGQVSPREAAVAAPLHVPTPAVSFPAHQSSKQRRGLEEPSLEKLGEAGQELAASAVEHCASQSPRQFQQPKPSDVQQQQQQQRHLQRPPRPPPPPREGAVEVDEEERGVYQGERIPTDSSKGDQDAERQRRREQLLGRGEEEEGVLPATRASLKPTHEKKKKRKKKKRSEEEEEGMRVERAAGSPAPTRTSSSTGWDSAGSSRSPSPSPAPPGQAGKRSSVRTGSRGRERKRVVFGEAMQVGPGARAKEAAETEAPPAAGRAKVRAKGRGVETVTGAVESEPASSAATDELEQQLRAVAAEVVEGKDGVPAGWTAVGLAPAFATALSLVSWVLGVVALSLSAVAMGGVSALAIFWRVHRYALTALAEEGNIAACFGFLYAFPHLVEYVSPWAPPWAPICLWYAFLVQVFCTSGPRAVVIPARVALPLLFLMEGVSHHSFLLDLNGAELLVIACALAGFKTQRWCNPLMLLSLSVQAILASFWGESLVLQWILLVGALSSLTLVAQCNHQAALSAEVAHEAFRRAHLDRLGQHFDALHTQGDGAPEQGAVAGLYGDPSRQALSVGYIAAEEPTAL